jgi:multisubunit Na+/H+ antiporter MnhC subunit
MNLKKNIPYTIASFLIAVGVLFCVSVLIDGVLIDAEPPGSHFLIGISILFMSAGIYYLYLLSRGKLEGSGKSIVEVRQEAIEKMDDPVLLARIASGDEPLEIRKTAQKRLEEINN